jgi:hypothetical protein
MYVLVCYCLILHMLSLLVLQIRYSWFKGAISAPMTPKDTRASI